MAQIYAIYVETGKWRPKIPRMQSIKLLFCNKNRVKGIDMSFFGKTGTLSAQKRQNAPRTATILS